MNEKTETRNMALFCDFENVALGVRDANYSAFNIQKVLERLLLKGSIVVKKAYCDWDRYKEFKKTMQTLPTFAWSLTRWTSVIPSRMSTPS